MSKPADTQKTSDRVFLKTVMLATGCELLGKSGAGALNATNGNTLELRDGYVIAYSSKTRRTILITFANIKAMELITNEANPLAGRNRRAYEARQLAEQQAAAAGGSVGE